jgi:hypothetical protein
MREGCWVARMPFRTVQIRECKNAIHLLSEQKLGKSVLLVIVSLKEIMKAAVKVQNSAFRVDYRGMHIRQAEATV